MDNKKSIKKSALLAAALYLIAGGALFAESTPFGADAVPDLFSAALSADGFSTTTGGSPASAINPAQGGEADRMIFNASYLALSKLLSGKEEGGFMQSIALGALFPTRYGVFGGHFRYIGGFEENQFVYFPVNPTFGGNLSAAKEVYPGMSLGIGLNFGFGSGTTISGDLGFRYNTGKLAFMDNFTIAVVLGNLGISYFPTRLTPMLGLSFDLINIKGNDGKPDPFRLGIAGDISFPSLFYPEYFNLIAKAGIRLSIAEMLTINVSWPGGSGFNLKEMSDNLVTFPVIPAVGIVFNISLPSSTERIAGGVLPSDGDLKIAAGFKPLYEGVAAAGGGISWYVGTEDKNPPVIKPVYPETAYFSPNNDGKSDVLEFPISMTDEKYIVSWVMEIKDESGNVVRVIENKEQRFESFNIGDFFKRLFSPKSQIELPSSIRWDGIKNTGELAADGKYTFTITSTDDSGNTAVTPVYETVVKNTAPFVSLNPLTDAQKLFDPKAQGGNSSVTFTLRGSAEDAWERAIFNSTGAKVRTFDNQSGTPSPVTWDGRNDSGQIAPDGVYTFRISVTDKAQNSASAEMVNIILDSREAGAFLTTSIPAIRPERNQRDNLVNFGIRLLLNDGIENWKLELKDESGKVQRSFTGRSPVPSSIGWTGLNDQEQIVESVYVPELTVNYTRGDVVKTTATTVLVDVTGPQLTFNTSPEYFSPDNDGENDELFISLTAGDVSPIAEWFVEIRAPEPPYPVFRRIEGRGSPANRIIWDGKSDKGELVQSAVYYPYTYSAADTLGNSSSIEGKIGIDVLVIREGDRLKIQIPSIVFRPNFADFVGLTQEQIDNNMRIIRRVAQILNQFREYRVQVEGHANPTQPLGAARDREEPELRRISEARARAIVDQLVRNGVTRSRLSASGAGGSNPIAPFEDRDNWWKNRRVEFYLIK